MIGGYNPWFHEELKRRLEARVIERAEALISGTIPDYPGYREECGRAAGLREAIETAEELMGEMLLT